MRKLVAIEKILILVIVSVAISWVLPEPISVLVAFAAGMILGEMKNE